MESSPLQFARDFERLKSDIARSPSPESALLRLVAFWQNLKERAALAAYRTYLEEHLQLLSSLLNEKNLTDMTIDELSVIGRFVNELPAGQIPLPYQVAVAQYGTLSAQSYARKLLYVGDYEEALAALGVENSLALTPEEAEGKNETEILRALCQRAVEKASPACGFLRSVLAELEFAREDLQQNRINCLFVEKDASGNSTRGRLRVLEGTVEPFDKELPTHEVTFESQIKTPDDPFVGVAYDALDALKALFRTRGDKAKAETEYHAHFSIQDSGHHFTGDSIGLAFALLSYAQAVKSDVTRHERLLPADIAVTGSIDKTGKILAVNDVSLRYKIDRAFFSPVKFLILPEENYPAAVKILKELEGRFPHRQLRLIGVESLSDAVDDRNIIRAEKVCMGEYIVRKGARYTRATKVQVPILAVLVYLLLAIVSTRTFAPWWFDKKPAFVERTTSGFMVLNSSRQEIWSKNFGVEIDTSISTTICIGDLNGDGKSEIAFMPYVFADYWPEQNMVFVFEANGELRFKRVCTIRGKYPEDDIVTVRFSPASVSIVDTGGGAILVTSAFRSDPARCHIRMWSDNGSEIGSYINSGACCFVTTIDINSDGIRDLLFRGINNRMAPKSCVLFVLPTSESRGVSPPYYSTEYDLRNIERGNQIRYLAFPPTQMTRLAGYLYNDAWTFEVESENLIRFDVAEWRSPRCGLRYFMNSRLRVLDVTVDDVFITQLDDQIKQKKHPEIEDFEKYLDERRDAVTYWTDSGWVTEGQLRAVEQMQSR